MRRRKNNTDFSAITGNRLKLRKVGSYVVVTNFPKRKMGKQSPAQKAHHKKFQMASRYAQHQSSNEVSRMLYSKGITPNKRSVYLVAMSDYFNAPKVEFIDLSSYHGVPDNIIRVKATDDFMVTRVSVSITLPGGELIEKGDATQEAADSEFWEYRATAANATLAGAIVCVKAYDKPGNCTTSEGTAG